MENGGWFINRIPRFHEGSELLVITHDGIVSGKVERRKFVNGKVLLVLEIEPLVTGEGRESASAADSLLDEVSRKK